MAILLMAPFLFAGVLAFLLCTMVKPMRRFALSSALLLAAMGPLLLGNLLAFALTSYGLHQLSNQGIAAIASGLDRRLAYLVIGVALLECAAIVAVHGWIIRRLTLNLFKAYFAFVTVGVMFLFGLLIDIACGPAGLGVRAGWAGLILLLLSSVAICALLVRYCVQRVREFRGPRPERWQPVTMDEY